MSDKRENKLILMCFETNKHFFLKLKNPNLTINMLIYDIFKYKTIFYNKNILLNEKYMFYFVFT